MRAAVNLISPSELCIIPMQILSLIITHILCWYMPHPVCRSHYLAGSEWCFTAEPTGLPELMLPRGLKEEYLFCWVNEKIWTRQQMWCFILISHLSVFLTSKNLVWCTVTVCQQHQMPEWLVGDLDSVSGVSLPWLWQLAENDKDIQFQCAQWSLKVVSLIFIELRIYTGLISTCRSVRNMAGL